MSEALTIKQLLEAGVHFGHRSCFWNPKMAPYIFCTRNRVHIINLDKTLEMYKDACNFLGSVASKRGKILFVGTKQPARNLVREAAIRCEMPYVDYRWLGGMLTNYKTIRRSLKRLQELENLRDSATFNKLTKRESLVVSREITKLEKSLGGIRNMGGIPDAIFILDVGYENIAVAEANKLQVPIVGVVDTNNSPDGIDYVIPGNDDSLRAIKLYLDGIADAIIEARKNLPPEEVKEKAEEDRAAHKRAPHGKRVFKKKPVVEKSETPEVVDEKQEVTEEKAVAGDEEKAETAESKVKKTVKKAAKTTKATTDETAKSAETAKKTAVTKKTTAKKSTTKKVAAKKEPTEAKAKTAAKEKK